ncbi:MAG: hypothetical protein ACP5OC_02060 [Thermoplasmata archaeon]
MIITGDAVAQYRLSNSAFMRRGIPMLLVPIILLLAVIFSGDFYYLEYFHVITGSAWTGMDLVMGLFFAFVMRGLSNTERVEVSKRLIPTMLFFMPSIASVTVTAGIYTAMHLQIAFSSPYFIATGIIVLILIAQGFALFLPNELRIYLELLRGGKDVGKIVRLTMFNLKLSLSQLVFQIAVIVLMAHFTTGYAL